MVTVKFTLKIDVHTEISFVLDITTVDYIWEVKKKVVDVMKYSGMLMIV